MSGLRRALLASVAALATLPIVGCTTASPPAWTLAPAASATPSHASASPALGRRSTAYVPARTTPPLRLTDQDGRPFDLASLRGEPVLVYFGYTHCPDICPTTLADARDAVRLADVPAKVVFVTVDPGRDVPSAMRQYVDFYGAGFIGLTGSAAEVAAATAAWAVSSTRMPSPSGSTAYAMAHSTDLYLVDAAGTLTDHIFFGAGPALIAERLRAAARP